MQYTAGEKEHKITKWLAYSSEKKQGITPQKQWLSKEPQLIYLQAAQSLKIKISQRWLVFDIQCSHNAVIWIG